VVLTIDQREITVPGTGAHPSDGGSSFRRILVRVHPPGEPGPGAGSGMDLRHDGPEVVMNRIHRLRLIGRLAVVLGACRHCPGVRRCRARRPGQTAADCRICPARTAYPGQQA
jgi:hypothetical protein